MDELPGESSLNPPTLPPKGKFVSTGSLVPPSLPPKKLRIPGNGIGQGLVRKRVAISTDEVRVIGIGGYNEDNTEDDDTFSRSEFNF